MPINALGEITRTSAALISEIPMLLGHLTQREICCVLRGETHSQKATPANMTIKHARRIYGSLSNENEPRQDFACMRLFASFARTIFHELLFGDESCIGFAAEI